jgi:hypothetical protein
MADWQKMLSAVAPWIGAAATGGVPALVGMAAVQVGQAFGTDVKATTDAIAQAIGGASPDQLLALKSADNDFAAKMQALGFQNTQALEQIAANDRDSARKRQTAMGDWTPSIISFLIIAAFSAVMYLFMTQEMPEQGAMRDSMLIMIGTLAAAFTQVTNYYLGSSAGSAAKTEIMGRRP